jgi:hypothetical protein
MVNFLKFNKNTYILYLSTNSAPISYPQADIPAKSLKSSLIPITGFITEISST